MTPESPWASDPTRVSENPVMGTRHIFLVTSEETGGEYVKIRAELPPHSVGSPMHFHVNYTERYVVVEGRLDAYLGKTNHVVLTSGQSAFVPLNTPHKYWNSTNNPTIFEAEIRPAANFEKAIRAIDGLARDGKTNRNGLPKNPFELALLFELAETYQPIMPLFFQRTIFGALAKVARWRGYDSEFRQYTRPQTG